MWQAQGGGRSMVFPSSSVIWVALLFALVCVGCGTTRTTNTSRTATEQLLISDAIDRAVQEIDFSKLAGQSVFFDERHLYEVVDDGYLISSLRQHLLASGCVLKDQREQADYVVEPRAGAVGTDNDDLLLGIPAINLPQATLLAGIPSALPEVPIVKRRYQRGVAKLAVFAYHRETGQPAWQSGIETDESSASDVWVLGAGPFRRGTIHKGMTYDNPQHYLPGMELAESQGAPAVELGQQAVFGSLATKQTLPKNRQNPQVAKVPPRPAPPSTSGSPPSASKATAGPPIFPPPTGGMTNTQ